MHILFHELHLFYLHCNNCLYCLTFNVQHLQLIHEETLFCMVGSVLACLLVAMLFVYRNISDAHNTSLAGRSMGPLLFPVLESVF